MTRPASWILCLCLLALPLGYAVLTGGADDPDAFAVTVFDLGLAGLAGSLLLFRAAPASRPERLINAAAILFLVYVAFQLVPLPIPLLRILSPMRAEVAEALSPFTGPVRYAPLSVAPPTTWLQLARITAYAITFFVSRQLVRRSPFGPWTAALPIVLVGAAEAAWALATSGGAMQLLSGSYPNRNHFAGLLEMTLPFALMYGVSVLYRSGRRGVLAMTDVANAAVPFSLTVLMLVALLFSSSKSGVIASLFSLFFVTALALGRGLSRGRRWTFLALLTLLFLVAFVFLTPSELVQRFGSVASDQPTEGRVPVWRDTLRLIAAYPLFGCGLGAFFPAFLRYQIAGVGWAWTNAHNDYLQLFSELGFVGFLAPATLMTVVFGRAVSAASEPEARETRFIGLACAGSLTAILIHSVTDFNTYVTANGLVLAWVAGVAATLGPPAAVAAPRASARIEYGVGPIVLLLGVLTTAYGAGWLMLLQRSDEVATERMLCRFGVCDTETALRRLRDQTRAAAPDTVPTLAPEVLISYLGRDPAAPYRWDELGDSLVRAGRHEQARTAFMRAVALGPTSASTLLMAAEFQFDAGRSDLGFELTSRALKAADAQLYDAAFSLLAAKQVEPAHVPEALGMDRPAALAFLRHFLRAESLDVDAARSVWAWVVRRGFADDQIAGEHTTVLLSQKLEREAWDDWLQYARARREGMGGPAESRTSDAVAVPDEVLDYPASNRIFNSGFERESAGGPFDWRIDARAGVKATFDRTQPRAGARSLRLAFDGSENVGEIGVMQQVYLEPGHYIFRAEVRSQNLTTDQGMAFRISCNAPLVSLDQTTDAVRGTTDWTTIAAGFDVPEGCGLVSVRLVRKTSLKFDKLFKGQAWLDAVEIASPSQ